MSVKIQIRADSASAWASNNTILFSGEVGFDVTNKKFKVGDGATPWNSLLYMSPNGEELNNKISIDSPDLIGVPTAPTASVGTNTNQIATTAFFSSQFSSIIASAPENLNTLQELAAALNNDPNFATSTASAIGDRITINNAAALYLPASASNDTSFLISASSNFISPKIIIQTAEPSYTLSASNAGNILEVDTSRTASITVPSDNLVNFTIGTQIDILSSGTGSVVIMPPFNNNISSSITWTTQNSGFESTTHNDVIYANGQWVVVGDGGLTATSTDAVTWTTRTSWTTSNITNIIYGNGIFLANSRTTVAPGTKGKIATSTDAITWTSQDPNTWGVSDWAHGAAYGNGIWVLSGGEATQYIARSTDTVTWTSITFAGGTGTRGVVGYGNGLFVFAADAAAHSSTDGITWTTRVTGLNSRTRHVKYGDGIWVMTTDSNNRIRTSPDGITWTTRILTSWGSYMSGLAYGQGNWLLSGNMGLNPVRTSTDGITWVSTSVYGVSPNYAAIAFGKDTWVAAGGFGLIGTSSIPLPVPTINSKSNSRVVPSQSAAFLVKRNNYNWILTGDLI